LRAGNSCSGEQRDVSTDGNCGEKQYERAGTNEIEKTVFIKAPKNLNYGSVAKVVDAVKTSGAAPIGLQIDDLQ